MVCLDAWLANVHAAGGDLEPPPSPTIPAEYLQKPRRRPALGVSHPTRQRRADWGSAQATNSNDRDAGSSECRSSSGKYFACNAACRASQCDGTGDPLEAHSAFITTGPKATYEAAPVLKTSISAEYIERNVGDGEVESAYESITSKRSRSPTRRMVDLQIARKPVVSKSATSSAEVPQDVRALYKAIQALARRSKGVIPLGIESEVDQDTHGDFDDLEHYVAKTSNGKTHEQLKDEFKAMREIRNGTSACITKRLHEPSWNELVHSQMLKQAVLGRPGFSYYNITTARVIKELVPGDEYGELLKGKMVDFAVTLGPPLIPTAQVINRLAASPLKLQRTINPSDYSPLCYKPVVLSIATKSSDADNENGEVQLSLWAMAYFNRLRQFIQDPVAITLPLLFVTGDHWKLYFASDLTDEIHLIDAVDIGTTADIIGCYTILEALRVILGWVEDTFSSWFLNGMNPE